MEEKPIHIAPYLYNIKNFYFRSHPVYHPDTKRYLEYWEVHEQRAVEGFWGLDQKSKEFNKDKPGGYRFMTGPHYWYTNFCFISHQEEETSVPLAIQPDLRDIDWYDFYVYIIADGFSGFENDIKYTCHILVNKYNKEGLENFTPKEKIRWKRIKNEVYHDNKLKQFIHPLKYLKSTFSKPLGLPLYSNTLQNVVELSSRGVGKSFRLVGKISHKYNFFGAKTYKQYRKTSKGPVICVGSALSSKSGELLEKFKFTQDQLAENFGNYEDKDTGYFVPGFFHKLYAGSLNVGNGKNPYRHIFKIKKNNVWIYKGSRTSIVHQSYENNPEAFVGVRSVLMVEEELGLNDKLLSSSKADETVMIMNSKIGFAWKTGCVCAGTKVFTSDGRIVNIEDLKERGQKDIEIIKHSSNGIKITSETVSIFNDILGYDGKQTISQNINFIKKPQFKECYRITTRGNIILECSHDHPLLTKVNYNSVGFVNAENLKIGDRIASVNNIDSYGDISNKSYKYQPRKDGKGNYFEKIDNLTNINLSTITNIEYIGEQKVYNLNAQGTNTYITNGFISANTGGNIEKVQQAKEIFNNPEAYGYMSFPNLWEDSNHRIGMFMPAYYQNSEFRDENGNQDIYKAFEQEMYDRKKRSESGSTSALDGWITARPIKPSEMFLSPELIIFPTSALRDQRTKLELKNFLKTVCLVGHLKYDPKNPQKVKFIKHEDSYLKPITTFNTKIYDGHLNGRVVIIEQPNDNIPRPSSKKSLYKVVYDPYIDDGSGPSLASILVHKGYTEKGWNEGLQNTIVASYHGRMDTVQDVHDIAIKLAIYYNAKVLVENDVPDFIRYCKMKNLYHLLQISPYEAVSKFISSPNRKYEVGLRIGQGTLKKHAEQLARQWLLEERDVDEKDNKILNLHYVYDLKLLDDFINYDGKKNTDAVSAFMLLMFWLYQEKLSPINSSAVQENAKNTVKEFFEKTKSRNISYLENLL